jgi:hypothetical protein
VKPIYCPRCGSLVGFQFDDVNMPKVEKVKVTVGDKEYPTIDLDKLGDLPLFCQFCGHEFKPKKGKEGR